MIEKLHDILEMLEGGFREIRILVLGDLMIDHYIVGDVERISPEAPVPVLRHVRRYSRPGGAANVAMNLAGLGVRTLLAGLVGDDKDGEELRSLLSATQIDTRAILSGGLPTISKTRILGRTQQMLRLDVESRAAHAVDDVDRMVDAVVDELGELDAIVLSDYAKGVLSEAVCRKVIGVARERGIKVLVDPKSRSFAHYAGATTICPNLNELSVATGVPAHKTEDLLAAARNLAKSSDIDFLTVTMSEAGIRLVGGGEEYHSPARVQEVADVSGAGDTVIATLAASLAAGLERETAVELANIAAGIVVGKIGTVPVRAEEIVQVLTARKGSSSEEKIVDRERALQRVREWRSVGESIVFTNGCFDLVHVGHVTLLEKCREFGSKLVLGLNTNASVQRLKGPTRPVVSERDRARVMAAMESVDLVVLFDEDTPLELIQLLKPDVLVKGGDYTVETVVGHGDVTASGGRVEIVKTVPGFSTTNLVKKLTGGC